jgi:hypothetical protein
MTYQRRAGKGTVGLDVDYDEFLGTNSSIRLHSPSAR